MQIGRSTPSSLLSFPPTRMSFENRGVCAKRTQQPLEQGKRRDLNEQLSLSVPFYNLPIEWMCVHQQGYVGDLDMYEKKKKKRKEGGSGRF
jgi:hypothetical protein